MEASVTYINNSVGFCNEFSFWFRFKLLIQFLSQHSLIIYSFFRLKAIVLVKKVEKKI